MGKTPSTGQSAAQKKRLTSRAHEALLEMVYEHPGLIVDHARTELSIPRPTVDFGAAQDMISAAFERRLTRLRPFLDDPKLSSAVRNTLEAKIQEITSASIEDVVQQEWKKSEDLFLHFHGSTRSHKISLQPNLRPSAYHASKKSAGGFIDMRITEQVVGEPYVYPDEDTLVFRHGSMRSFSLADDFADENMTTVSANERHASSIAKEDLPDLSWVTEKFEVWVEIRPEDDGVGSLIADMKTIMEHDIDGCTSSDRSCMLCIGVNRSQAQVDMLRSAGVLYLGQERLAKMVTERQQSERA